MTLSLKLSLGDSVFYEHIQRFLTYLDLERNYTPATLQAYQPI